MRVHKTQMGHSNRVYFPQSRHEAEQPEKTRPPER